MSEFVERLRRLPEDVVSALSFFSRLPVDAPARPFDLSRVAGAWPAAGLLLAVAPATVVVVNDLLGIPAAVTAFLALAAGLGLTGALHEDGLADTFDGLGGGRGRTERLAIMRDSRLGTFGALALLLALLVKGSALASLLGHPSRAVLALLACAMVSRAMALWHWSATGPARRDGMAYSAGRPDPAALQIGLLSGLAGAIVLTIAFGFASLLGLALAALATGLFSRLVEGKIGGHTGDTIGAAQAISETLLFVGLSSVSATNFP